MRPVLSHFLGVITLFLGLTVALGGIITPAWAADLTFTGKLVCSLKRTVLLPFPGEIISLTAQPGQEVKEGEVLARYHLAPEAVQRLRRRLSPSQITELRAKLAEADKGLTTLKTKEKTARALARQKLASPQRLAQLEREIKALSQQRGAIAERLQKERQFLQGDKTLLKKRLGVPLKSGQVPEEGALVAPMNGHVVWLHPELRQGAMLKKGTPVLMVGVLDPMILKARVHEIEALKLKVGEPADITLESLPGRTFQARVGRLPWAPGVFSMEHPTYYEVEFQVPNPDLVLKEGLKATLVVRQAEPKAGKADVKKQGNLSPQGISGKTPKGSPQ